MSGKTLNRPELDRLRADVRLGTVERVYTFRLDRITRSGVADTFTVVQEMRKANCTLITAADGYVVDDSDAADAVVFALSLGAKIERAAISDRIKAARQEVERQGRHWGRPPRMTPAEIEKARK